MGSHRPSARLGIASVNTYACWVTAIAAWLAMASGAHACPEGALDLARPTPPAEATEYETDEERLAPVEVFVMAEGNLPLSAGGRLRLVLGRHLVVDGGLGRGVFGGAYDFAARAAGFGAAGPVLSRITNGATVIEGRVGIRPSRRGGLDAMVGIGRITTSDRLSGSMLGDLVDEATDARYIDVALSLRYVSAELGYGIRAGRRLVVRIALGYLHVRRSRVTLVASPDASSEMVRNVDVAADAIQGALEAWGQLPSISLTMGARLGVAEPR